MYDLEFWENELFDKYNDEGHQTEEEVWAEIYDEDFAMMEDKNED